MIINKKIEQMVNLGATLIEINPIEYRQLTENTLEILKANNVKVDVTDKVKSACFHKYNVDCFAYMKSDKTNGCFCLKELYCGNEKCRFYQERKATKRKYLDTYTVTTASLIAKNIDKYFRNL